MSHSFIIYVSLCVFLDICSKTCCCQSIVFFLKMISHSGFGISLDRHIFSLTWKSVNPKVTLAEIQPGFCLLFTRHLPHIHLLTYGFSNISIKIYSIKLYIQHTSIWLLFILNNSASEIQSQTICTNNKQQLNMGSILQCQILLLFKYLQILPLHKDTSII